MSVLDRFRLAGKRLFTTGGSRGLGREMALAIADASADVVLTGRDPRASSAPRTTCAASGVRPGPSRPTSPTLPARRSAQHDPLDILLDNVGGRRDPAPRW